jgi:iron complex outermembrane receptor protein
MRRFNILLCGVSLSVIGAAAHAQAVSTAPVAQVKEIVVVAQRRAEKLEDVPITITNVDAQQLKNIHAQTIADVVQLTPALRYDYQGAFTQATIRGVGTTIVGPGSGSNVGTYVDGFYIVNPLATDFQLLNVSNVEVLKGPQGTLFGRNTSGGAILVTTSKPSHDTHAVIEGSYGSYDAAQGNFYGTTGIGDSIAVDLAAIYSRGDGYTKDLATGSDKVGRYRNWTIRAGLLFDVSPDLSFLFRYTHSHVNDPTSELENAVVKNGVVQNFAAGLNLILPGTATYATRPNRVDLGFPVSVRSKSDIFQLTGTWDLHFATLTSYSQYRKDSSVDDSSLAVSNPDFGHTRFITPNELYTQEFLLASRPGPRLQWTTGLFFFDNRQSLSALLASGPVPPTTFAGGSEAEYRSYAAFADATYQVTDQLFLTAGVRYSYDEALKIFNNLAGPGGTIIKSPIPKISKGSLTPRAVIRYQLDPGSNVYFSFSRGFKAAVPDLGDAIPVVIKPEHVSAYEVGYKHAEARLRFDVSAFYYDWKNIQVTNLLATPTATLQVTRNAAAARIYGLDGQAAFDVTPDLAVNVAAAYTHARYKNFPNSPTYDQCLAAACGPAFGGFLNNTIDAHGFHLPRSPDFTASVGAVYHRMVADGHFALSANYYYTSKIYFDTSDQYWQKAYNTLALRAEWTDPSDRYTVAVYGANLTNEHYKTQVLESFYGIGATWSAPVTFGGSIRIKLQ